MKKKLLAISVLTAVLTGCGGGGDVNIAPSTEVNNPPSNGGGNGGDGGSSNPCASYDVGGTTRQGSQDGANCIYGSDFVDFDNPLTVDLTIPALPNNGAHIFRGSIFVGENQKGDQSSFEYQSGGEGPTLTVEAGATVALETSSDFVAIHRGSQIIAEGTAANPIVFTSRSDVEGTIDYNAVSQWGGMIINGFGITNKCAYDGNLAADGSGLTLQSNTCDVSVEGTEGQTEASYGGNDNADSSGVLKYVVVKHTGAEIAPDNELNGITFGAVGSGTVVDHLQSYSTYDDGIEFFGGAVDISHYVALYVRDDSIDIDEGYRGTVEYALVIQDLADGAHCVEADGIGSWNTTKAADMVPRNLHSQATLKNISCLVTPSLTATGATHEAGAGLMIREDHAAKLQNMIVTTAFQADPSGVADSENYCMRHRNQSVASATMTASVMACADLFRDGSDANSSTWAAGQTGNQFYASDVAGQNPEISTDNGLQLLDGFYSISAADLVVDGAAAGITPVGGESFIGGVSADDDWTQGWVYGLAIQNWGEPLWVAQ